MHLLCINTRPQCSMAEKNPKATWATGLFGFLSNCEDCMFCCMALPCGCIAYGMNSATMEDSGCISTWACTYFTCYPCCLCGSICSDECSSTDANSQYRNCFSLVLSPICWFIAPLTHEQANSAGKQLGIYTNEEPPSCCYIDENSCPSIWCWPCMLTKVHHSLKNTKNLKPMKFKGGQYVVAKTKNSMFENIKLT